MSSEDERESVQESIKLENKRRRKLSKSGRVTRRKSSRRNSSNGDDSPKVESSKKLRNSGKRNRASPARKTNNPYADILEDIKEDVVTKDQFIAIQVEPSPNGTDSTTDINHVHKMYVQTARGFKSVSAQEDLDVFASSSSNNSESMNFKSMAISIQSFWIGCSTLCHGFLGGISVAHLLFILTTMPQDWPLQCLKKYAVFAELYGNMFYFLAIICLVSVLDRMDLACIKLTQRHSLVWIFILVLYSTTILLSLCCDIQDKRLFFFGGFNVTVTENEMRLNKLFNSWNNLSIGRSVGAILGWISIGIVVPNDHHLLDQLK